MSVIVFSWIIGVYYLSAKVELYFAKQIISVSFSGIQDDKVT